MRPRPLSRGNVSNPTTSGTSGTASMRPRPLSRGNPVGCGIRPRTKRVASMRPRPLSRGNKSMLGMKEGWAKASMRPRPLSRGNSHVIEMLVQRLAASMRPRPLSRGNYRLSNQRRQPRSGFNEAAAVKPRKRAGRPCISRTTRGFNEAAAVKPRKPDLSSAKDYPGGEASMRPRPLSRGNSPSNILDDAPGKASMRPRPLSRGNAAAARTALAVLTRFNEAAAVKPRKQLQPRTLHRAHFRASMRPRPLSRGNNFSRGLYTALTSGLQ